MNKDINPAVPRHDLANDLSDILSDTDIERRNEGLMLEICGDRVELFLAPSGKNDLGACLAERDGGGSTNAAGCAGNPDDFVYNVR